MSERRPLGLNVAANAVTAASVLLTALISVPLMLDEELVLGEFRVETGCIGHGVLPRAFDVVAAS